MRIGKGFSFIELLVVVTIVGLFLGLGAAAIPWSHFSVNQSAERLSREVQLARFEAVQRNEFVGVAFDEAADTYTVFIDLDRNGANNKEPVIKTVAIRSNGVDITGISGANPIVYDTRGLSLSLASAGVQLNNRGGSYARRVCISQQGRTRIVAGTSC